MHEEAAQFETTECKAICIHEVAHALHSVTNLKFLILEKHIPKAVLGSFGESLSPLGIPV